MNEFVTNTVDSARQYAPKLLAAVAILVVGWIVAVVLSRVVRMALRKVDLDRRINRSMSREEGAAPPVEATGIISRGVYFLVMLLSLVACFQALGLTLITEPLNSMLSQVMSFLPQALGAGVLLLVAWVVASVVRAGLSGVFGAMNLDEKLGDSMRSGEEVVEAAAEARMPVSRSLADAAYWLVFLLFLPAIVSALGMSGLLGPAEDLVGKILAFLPNLLAATLIFVVGWFVARIVQRVVTNLLAAAGADRLAERIGLASSLGQQGLSGALGMVLYALVLLPVLIASLNALKIDALTQPASEMLNTILSALPALLASTMVLAVAYAIGRIVSRVVTNVLAGIGFNNVLGKLGVSNPNMSRTPSELVGGLALIAIMFFAVVEAFNMLGLESVSAMAGDLAAFAGQVLMGVIILGAGLFVANFVGQLVRESGARNAGTLALVARSAVLVLTAAMALRQMGLASDIINLAFGLLLGAVAIASAVAFGMGGRHLAERKLAEWSQEGPGGLRSKKAQS